MIAPNILSLDLFVETSRVLHSDQFSGRGCFDLLGSGLGQWLRTFLTELGVSDQPVIKGMVDPGAIIRGPVYIADGATVEPTAFIQGPCYIGPAAEVRHGAYIRGNVYVGAKAVVGHASELKGSVLFDHAKAAHFAYVGDSILGHDVNLGAGTRLANLKLRGNEVRIKHPTTGAVVGSGLRKFGAIMGDRAATGCNAVLSPGTLLMPGTSVFPCVHYHGTLVKGSAH